MSDNTNPGVKTRRVSTNIDAANGRATVSYDGQVLADVDVQDFMAKMSPEQLRTIVSFGIVTILARATGGDNPQAGVDDALAKLMRGDWRPGRQRVEAEPEPIIQAIGQHLGQPLHFVVDRWLPAYCEKQGHVAQNGRLLMERAKRELERHPALGPMVAKILQQRAKRDGTAQPAVDLGAIEVEPTQNHDQTDAQHNVREAAE